MKNKLGALFLIIAFLAVIQLSAADNEERTAASSPATNTAMFTKLADAKWNPIIPELGADSPQICILHVDPTTKATQLLIRAPKAIHVRKHWHAANETHTMIQGTATLACEGQKTELGVGGFNYMPAKMVHEAWLSTGSLTFITVDAAWDVNWVEGPPTTEDVAK